MYIFYGIIIVLIFLVISSIVNRLLYYSNLPSDTAKSSEFILLFTYIVLIHINRLDQIYKKLLKDHLYIC